MTQVQKELFTDLSQEQCETVEGGLFVFIDTMQAVKAGADFIGKDDTYVTVDGSKIWGVKSFSSGQTRTLNIGTSVDGSSARVNLFDDDPSGFPFYNKDDSMGGFTAYNTNGALRRARVSGSGSTYDVYYRTFG